MNAEAAANGRPPYRLWVEGHVSVALHGASHARRLSRKRAQLCASLIRLKLQALDAELTAAHANGLVAAVGMGHTMPLVRARARTVTHACKGSGNAQPRSGPHAR